MPVKALSGTDGLYKAHNRSCGTSSDDLTKCDCRWRGRHRGVTVPLAKWSRERLDPRSKTRAKVVLARFVTAVDTSTFDPRGEKAVVSVDGLLVRHLIDEWRTHYVPTAGVDDQPLKQNSLDDMLTVLETETTNDGLCLGALRVAQVVATPEQIADWLDTLAKEGRRTPNRGGKTFRRVTWSNATRNRYLSVLNRVFAWAVEKKRVDSNPCAQITIKSEQATFGGVSVPRIEEDNEQRLFAACAKLNEPRVKVFSAATLTFDKAERIRARVAKGEAQSAVADELDVTRSVVCDIVNGRIWTSATYARSTKGNEMERRLIGGFDAGLRLAEMLRVQVKHVDFRNPKRVQWDDGTTTKAYVIHLPETKAGKAQRVFAATARFVEMLDARRFLGPEGYVFGTEDGRQQKGMRKQVLKLFTVAGVPYGREIAQTWHTTRHEFISRMAERTNSPIKTKELARHANVRTTERYMHNREDALLSAVAGSTR